MYTPINQWAEDDRPREKFLLKGRISLSDSELLAILIGSGSRNESAVQLCQRILASTNNNLNLLGKLSIQQLIQFKGIGEAKAKFDRAGYKLRSSRSLNLPSRAIRRNSIVFQFARIELRTAPQPRLGCL